MEASTSYNTSEIERLQLRLEQNRQHNTVTLLSLLRLKDVTLAKILAKQKVTQCKLEHDLIELRHLKESLEPPVLPELNELKSKLEKEAKLENIYKSEINSEVLRMEKIKEVLSVNHKRIQKNVESILQSEYKKSFQDYILQSENATKINNDKKAVLSEIMNKTEVEKLQFETDMNKKIYDFEKLNESNESVEIKIVTRKQELAHLQNERHRNVAILDALNDDLHIAQNSLACMNVKIEEIEVMRILATERNSGKLTPMKNEMKVAKKRLEQLQQMEINALEEFEQKCNKIQELEDVVEKLQNENWTLRMDADERKDLAALKLKLEALFAKRQKLDEALTAVKLCEEEKLDSDRSLVEKISSSNNKITKLAELLEKYDQEALRNMAKNEVFVRNRLSLKSQIEYRRSSISRMQKERESSQETYNNANSNLNFKISVAHSERQEAICKYELIEKKLKQELDDYKYEQEKIYQRNRDDNKQILERLNTKCVTSQNLLREENDSLCHLDNLILEKRRKEISFSKI